MKKSTGLTALVIALLWITAPYARNASELVPDYKPLRPVSKFDVVLVGNSAGPGHIVIKFRRGAAVDDGRLRFAGRDAKRANDIVLKYGLAAMVPVIEGDASQIREKRMAAEDRVRMNLPDMSLYARTPVSDPAVANRLIGELNNLEAVEIAFYEPLPEVASIETSLLTTPNYEASQDYIDAAPGGVDARAAWTLPGGTGTGVRIVDIEFGWQLTHEDLSAGATAIVIGGNSSDNDHGTAVLGEMVSDRNGTGMTGIAYDAEVGVASVQSMSTASALTLAAGVCDPGDLILIELHAPGPHYGYQSREDQRGYIAMEFWLENFDAILNAYAAGVIVCEAAGNGAENYDDEAIYGSVFDTTFRNSHAIMCGAGYPPTFGSLDRARLDFSNYGERVNLQGYGTAVYTTGYGDLYDGGSKNSWYTGSFGGTSSASPIVTGAAASLSGLFRQMLGGPVDPDSIRNLLVSTGSPQMPSSIQHIGPRPNLLAAMGPLFTPVDSVIYGDIEANPGISTPLPVVLKNSHPVGDIYLPFNLIGPATLFIDSLTRGPRTSNFESVTLVFDNRFAGQAGYRLRADAGGGTLPVPGGDGIIAYLWVRPNFAAMPGQVEIADSAWLGSTTRLRLVTPFDDGYPDYFDAGSITIAEPLCDCPSQASFDGNTIVDAVDLALLIDIVFFGAPDVQDPNCPNARADFNCDEVSDAVDLAVMIDHVFFGGAGPCDPCL